MRVLVTRPQPGADATAQRAAARGHEPVVLPLTRTEPLVQSMPPETMGFGAVVATSAAAIRHASPELLALAASLPLHAVGTGTAQLARDAGLPGIAPPFADADALVAGLPGRMAAGSKILYLTGRLRTGAIRSRLEASGLRVHLVEVYDTVADEAAFAEAASRIGSGPLGAALVHSAYGAAMLSQLVARPEMTLAFAATRFICISARVAEALSPGVLSRAELASTPDDAAMLALLGPPV